MRTSSVDRGSGQVWSVNEKISLVSAHFYAIKGRDSFQQSHSCDPSPVLHFIAFRSCFVRSLLLDLDSYG